MRVRIHRLRPVENSKVKNQYTLFRFCLYTGRCESYRLMLIATAKSCRNVSRQVHVRSSQLSFIRNTTSSSVAYKISIRMKTGENVTSSTDALLLGPVQIYVHFNRFPKVYSTKMFSVQNSPTQDT